MKKPLLILAALSMAFAAQAQITVDITNIATVGDTLVLAEDTINGPSLDLGDAAGDQVWDFTSLTEHEPDGGILEDPSTAPLSANYPNATFVLNDLEEDSIHLFFERTNEALDIIGMVEYDSAGNPQEGDFIDTWRFMQFASTMGDSWQSDVISDSFKDTANFDPDGPGPHPFIDSIRSVFTLSFYNEIDAWGEVQLAQGTYLAIRQKMVNTVKAKTDCYYDGAWNPLTPLLLTFQDSVTYDTADEVTYRWWSDNESANMFIVEVETDTNGDATNSVVFTTKEPAWYTGISGLEQTNFSIYPNPSTNLVTIETEHVGTWKYTLFDINAKPVASATTQQNRETINVTNLAAGNYLLQATDNLGRILKLEKIQVIH